MVTYQTDPNDNADPVIIYVSGGNFNSPYYSFYKDKDGQNQLTSNILDISKNYRFLRLNNAVSHPFYISDVGWREPSTSKIELLGDGSASSGIVSDGSFVWKSVSLSVTDKLYFYCTAHSTMIGNFVLIDSSSTAALDVTAGSGGSVQYTPVSYTHLTLPTKA